MKVQEHLQNTEKLEHDARMKTELENLAQQKDDHVVTIPNILYKTVTPKNVSDIRKVSLLGESTSH
jgi:hypothetical protein